MRLLTTINEMKFMAREIRSGGKSLGLVPTMGALHDGHLSLVRQAKRQCDVVVVSIFVNPTQFGPGEDYDRYPRTLDQDLDLLSSLNIDAVFAPAPDEMYPEGFQTFVEPGPLAKMYEGASRPEHFRGVATVIVKLFNIVSPDVAYFGQKDFQQAIVIRRLAEDLHLNSRLVFCPIVRDKDGLAVSSRNAYLTPSERGSALALSRSLRRAEELAKAGECSTRKILNQMRQILRSIPQFNVDYVAIIDPARFEPVERVTAGVAAVVAARIGMVRLIDNAILGSPGTSADELLQMALAAPVVADTEARVPGLDAEAIMHKVSSCRDCAAISTILLPPREFMAAYLRRDYPDLNAVRVVVVGRHGAGRPDNAFYRTNGRPNRFVSALYDLLGVEEYETFKRHFVLTDVIRCHATGPRIPEKAMRNCARHLRNELALFPNFKQLVVLGEDAYMGVQRFLLGHDPAEVAPFHARMGSQGWAEDSVELSFLDHRAVQIIYCYHPSLGYKRSPSIAAMLQI